MKVNYSQESSARGADIRKEMAEKPVRKIKLPKVIAVVDQRQCTGCEACIQFCPVDCIELVPGPDFPDMGKYVEIDVDRCIGCKACAKYCPWDTILMVESKDDTYISMANDWTLRSVIAPGSEGSIWPRPEPAAEAAPAEPPKA